MAAFAQEMELLSRQLSQAHRAAIQAELLAAGLEEVNHPMLVSLLQCAEEDPAYPCQAQRDLAQQLHVSPAAVANALKGLERSGCIRREPWQDDARRNRVLLTEKGRAAVAGCREAFRRVSYIREGCVATVRGHGLAGYLEALRLLVERSGQQ